MINVQVVFDGIMLFIGEVKGMVFVLLVEILVVVMIGVLKSIEVLFFFFVDGLLLGVGQFLIVMKLMDMEYFGLRIEVLFSLIEIMDGVCLLGSCWVVVIVVV